VITLESKEVREQLNRWIEDGQHQLAVVLRVMQDYDRFRESLESSERENERLRGLVYENEKLHNRLETAERECELLREEGNRLRGETERNTKEREEIADWLSGTINEVLLRLRPQQA